MDRNRLAKAEGFGTVETYIYDHVGRLVYAVEDGADLEKKPRIRVKTKGTVTVLQWRKRKSDQAFGGQNRTKHTKEGEKTYQEENPANP